MKRRQFLRRSAGFVGSLVVGSSFIGRPVSAQVPKIPKTIPGMSFEGTSNGGYLAPRDVMDELTEFMKQAKFNTVFADGGR